MADIFAGTQPPAWLNRITEPAGGMLGDVIGDLVGGLANASEDAIDKATKKQAQGIETSWIKELPGSIKPGLAEARLNAANPLWRIQAQQAQLNLVQQGLQIQSQQSLIDSRKTQLQMQQHDQEVLPKWLQDHPTWESRQDAEPPNLLTAAGQRMYGQVRMADAQSTQRKAIEAGISAFSKSVAELQKIDPIAAAPFAAQIGKVPTQQMQDQIGVAMDRAQAKQRESTKPAVATLDIGGKKVQKIYNPKTGAIVKEQADEQSKAQEKITENELHYAQQRVLILEREMAKLGDAKGDKAKKDVLKDEWLTARKYYNTLLKRAKGTEAATPAQPQKMTYNPDTDELVPQ